MKGKHIKRKTEGEGNSSKRKESVVKQESKQAKKKENVCEKRFALKRKEEGICCAIHFFHSFLFLYFFFFCLHSAARSRMKMKVMKESVGKICTYEVHVPHFVFFRRRTEEIFFFNYALVKIFGFASLPICNALLTV